MWKPREPQLYRLSWKQTPCWTAIRDLTENQNNKNKKKVIKKQKNNNDNKQFQKEQHGTWLTECLPCQRSKNKVVLLKSTRVVQVNERPCLNEATIIMESDDDTEELLLFKSVFIKTEEETRPIAG